MRKTTILVIDSSVMVKWVNSQDEQYLDQADRLAIDATSGRVRLVAPELAKYEVGNAIWKKDLPIPMAKASLATIFASPVEFMTIDEELGERAMEIAIEASITFYDASFICLAEKLHAILVTDNPKHQKKFSGVTVLALREYKGTRAS